MRMHEGIEDAWLMHRSVSGHFGGGLFISEPINVSTWHQIRLGPLTTRGAITHRPWGLGKHLATTFLLSPPALLSTTNLFNLDWTQCLNVACPSRGWHWSWRLSVIWTLTQQFRLDGWLRLFLSDLRIPTPQTCLSSLGTRIWRAWESDSSSGE